MAALPLPILLAATLLAAAFPLGQARESTTLLILLNAMGSGVMAVLVTYLLARSFVIRRTPGLLCFGLGVAVWGASGLIGSAFMTRGVNAGVTAHNCLVWLAAALHLAAVYLLHRPPRPVPAPRLWLVTAAALVAVLVGLLGVAVAEGWLPTFFVQGQGGTPLRQGVLISAIGMVLLTAGLLRAPRLRTAGPFPRWYSLALGLVGVGLVAVLLQPAVGSVMNWVGRSAQLLAGLYMLIAAIVSVRESRAWEISLEAALHTSEAQFRVLCANLESGVALIDAHGAFEIVNPAFRRLFELPPDADILTVTSRDWAQWQVFDEHGTPLDVDAHPVRQAVRTGRAVKDQLVAVQAPGRPARKWMLVSAAPLLDAQGRLHRLICTYHDITARKLAEDDLEQTRRLLAEGQRIAHLGTFVHVAATQTTVWSEEEYRIYGLDPAGPSPPYDALLATGIHPEDAPLVDQAFTAAMRDGAVYELEHRIVRPDGSVRWVYDWAHPDRDARGTLVRYVGATLDITERKRAEAALRQRTEELQAILDTTPVAIFVAHDPECRKVTGNPAARGLVALPPDANISKSAPADERPTQWQEVRDGVPIAPADLPLQRAARGEEVRDYEMDLIFTDGTVKSVVGHAAPIRDEHGQPRGGVAILTDVTARRQAETAARANEERLQLTLQASAVGTFEVDLSTGIGRWNAVEYALLGLTPGEVPAGPETFFRYVHPQDGAELRARWAEGMRTGRLEAEFRVIRADGRERWLAGKGQFAFAALADAGSAGEGRSPLRFLGVNFDITERKRAEAALRQLNATLEQRIEARTAELARHTQQLRELAAELTLTEQRERRRLADVLHDEHQQLLVAAKLQLNRLHRTSDPEVQEVCREATALLQEAIGHSRSLIRDLSPPLLQTGGLVPALTWLARWVGEQHQLTVEVQADPTVTPATEELAILLYQAVRGLLLNVVKHAQVAAARLTVAAQDGQVRIAVEDAGVGFDPAQRSAAIGSGGFGLFSLEQRLPLLGGSLAIVSAPGQGSRITLRGPCRPAGVSPAAGGGAPRPGPGALPETGPTRTLRLLLVDDHAVVRQALARMLSDESDMEVVGEAADGKVAVELARQLQPDIVLMDINMPVLNGIKATQAIRAEFPSTQVIGLSMHEDVEQAKAMKAAGAVGYVSKSSADETLLAAIRTCAGRAQAE